MHLVEFRMLGWRHFFCPLFHFLILVIFWVLTKNAHILLAMDLLAEEIKDFF